MNVVVLADVFDVDADRAAAVVRLAAALVSSPDPAAGDVGGGTVTCLLGSEPDDEQVAALAACGATALVWADLPDDGRTSAAVAALAACTTGDDLVLVPAGRTGNEIAARLALRLGRPLSVGADGLTVVPGGLRADSSAFTGTWRMSAELPTAAVVTVAAGTDAPATASPTAATASPRVERLAVDPVADPLEWVVLSVEAAAADTGPSLTQAAVVVSGGRGTEGDFAPLEELAGLLGGAVGSSRVAVDLGWARPERQVGQTGVTVSPEVYIAAGISGAVQHLAGIGSARCVVAINTDPDAPIFRRCDLGIVGDLHTVTTQAVALLRASA